MTKLSKVLKNWGEFVSNLFLQRVNYLVDYFAIYLSKICFWSLENMIFNIAILYSFEIRRIRDKFGFSISNFSVSSLLCWQIDKNLESRETSNTEVTASIFWYESITQSFELLRSLLRISIRSKISIIAFRRKMIPYI